MLLRWIVNQYLRDAAEGRVREVLADVLQPGQRAAEGRGGPTVDAVSVREAAEETRAARDESDDEFLPCDILFIYALGIEAGGLVDLLKDSERSKQKHGVEHAGVLEKRQVAIVEGGVGQAAAGRAARAAIEFYKPRWVVSAGFGGGLAPEVRKAQIVMADDVANVAGERLAVGLKLTPEQIQATKGLHVGRLLTVDDLVRKPAARAELFAAHGAIACDMETFAVARACEQTGTRFLSVRIITDAADDELPPEIERLLAQKTLAGKLGAAAGAVLNRFSAAKDLWQLREDALKASDRLAKFLRGIATQLT